MLIDQNYSLPKMAVAIGGARVQAVVPPAVLGGVAYLSQP
jgi:hypothetical protein